MRCLWKSFFGIIATLTIVTVSTVSCSKSPKIQLNKFVWNYIQDTIDKHKYILNLDADDKITDDIGVGPNTTIMSYFKKNILTNLYLNEEKKQLLLECPTSIRVYGYEYYSFYNGQKVKSEADYYKNKTWRDVLDYGIYKIRAEIGTNNWNYKIKGDQSNDTYCEIWVEIPNLFK